MTPTTHKIPSQFVDEIVFELDGFTAQLCTSPESKKVAYELRYRAYIETGAVEPNALKQVHDAYDDLPNSRTHLLWYEGEPVASVRSSIWSSRYDWSLTESIKTFWYETHGSIGLDKSILESSRFVVDPKFQGRNSLRAQLLLFRLQDLSSTYDECDHIITSVREKHVPFYKRMLSFEQISGQGRVPWIDVDVVLLRTTANESRNVIATKGMQLCSQEERQRYATICETLKKMYHAA